MEQFTQELHNLYRKLQDDESRFVFKEQLLYFLDGDEEHRRKLFENTCDMDRARKALDEIRELQKSGRKIVFYGAGVRATRLKPILGWYNITAYAFCDRDINKQNTIFMGLPVISVEKLAEDYKDAVIVISVSALYSREINRYLKSLGFSSVYDIFPCYEVSYFNHSFFSSPRKDEIYIDCGVLDGKTIEKFAAFSKNNYKKIYAFEPDNASYARSLAYIEKQNIQRVEILKKGAWSETTSISFSDSGDGASCISPNGTATVAVTTIDEVVGNDDVTFIKMDIEGAELEALKGAAKTISRCKPRLAICIYHKPEDILELPLFIQSLVPEYEFYLRPHWTSSTQYVLYAR